MDSMCKAEGEVQGVKVDPGPVGATPLHLKYNILTNIIFIFILE